jgi:phosphoglycerate dehydrogenase-like enzyme
MTPPTKIYVAVRADEFDRLFPPDAAAELRALGEVEFGPEGPRVPVPGDLGDSYDILVTSWSTEPFPPERLVGSRLRMAVHAAGSVRGLFPRSAVENGLTLAQGGAAAMAEAVAEMAATLTLALLRNLHVHDRGMQTTRDWMAAGHGMLGRSVAAQRVGILSLSRVGRHYARLMAGLGATHLTAYDPYASTTAAAESGVRLVGLDELCADSDVLCVCAPSTPETRHLIGAAQLTSLPDGAVFINVARSALVDGEALEAELRTGRISAGLDVFDEEPLSVDSPYFGLPNVLLTPHVAGGTVQARASQGRAAVAEIARFVRGERLEHEVTADIYDRLA